MTGRSTLYKGTVKTAAGRSFGALVREEAAAIYDKILYVDIKRGSDSNDGESWDSPLYSINGAMTRLYGGDSSSETLARNRSAFAVIFRAYNTGSDTYPTQQKITVDGVHLIGAGEWYGAGSAFQSAFLVNGNDLTTDSALTATPSAFAGLSVHADDVIVSGIHFSLRDATNNPAMLAFTDVDNATGNHAGRSCGVFNCTFEGDSGGSGTHYGLALSGNEATKVVGNQFRYHTVGVVLAAGPNRDCYGNIFDKNEFEACGTAIKPYGLTATVTQNRFNEQIVMQKGTYGVTFSKGIDFTLGQYNYCTNCFVGHATGSGTSYVAGTSNFFHRCWFGDTGAAATEYTGT